MSASTIQPNLESDSGTMSPVRLAMLATGGVGLLMVLVVLLVGSGFAAWSVGVGVALAEGNLLAFSLLGRGLLHHTGGARVAWALAAAFKFVLLLLVVALLLRYKIVGGLPLIIGYGALPVGITLSNWLNRLVRQDQG